MRRSSTLLVFGLFLLLVAQHEVSARNYLWWALGLEEDEKTANDGRMLRQHNVKTRERISDTRQHRREGRRTDRAATTANVAPQTRTIRLGAPITTRKDGDKKKKKKNKDYDSYQHKNEAVPIGREQSFNGGDHKRFNLRDKVAQKLQQSLTGGGKQKHNKKQKQNFKYVGVAHNSRSNGRGGGGGHNKKKKNGHKYDAKHEGKHRPEKQQHYKDARPAGNSYRSKDDRGKHGKHGKDGKHGKYGKQTNYHHGNKKKSEKRFKTKLNNKRSRAHGDKGKKKAATDRAGFIGANGGHQRQQHHNNNKRLHQTEAKKREEKNHIKRQQEHHARAKAKPNKAAPGAAAHGRGGNRHNRAHEKLERNEHKKREQHNHAKRQQEHAARARPAITPARAQPVVTPARAQPVVTAARARPAIGVIDVTTRAGTGGGSVGVVSGINRAQAQANAQQKQKANAGKNQINRAQVNAKQQKKANNKKASQGRNQQNSHARIIENAHARMKEKHFERKVANHNKHKAEKTAGNRQGRGQGRGRGHK